MEARFSRLHYTGLAVAACAMLVFTVVRLAQVAQRADWDQFNPMFAFGALTVAVMAFYIRQGVLRFADRQPQIVIDSDGILLGFGRNRRFGWDDIQWAHLHRIGLRPQLQLGLRPDVFVAADLRLSTWNLDDGLRLVRGMPAAVAVRDNGLDTRAAAMLDAVKRFRPNLVRP
jgi:hypothetical protein